MDRGFWHYLFGLAVGVAGTYYVIRRQQETATILASIEEAGETARRALGEATSTWQYVKEYLPKTPAPETAPETA